MSETKKVFIFSVDLVFVNILKRILEEIDRKLQVVVFQSFSEAKDLREKESVDCILTDDLITGTSSLELVSFLRLHKKIICPIFYFGTSEYEGKRKALLIGANRFFKKPFKPNEIKTEITNILQKKEKKNFNV